MGTVRYPCKRRLGGQKCGLTLGHDGDCDPYPPLNLGKAVNEMFQSARLFFCHGAADVAQVAKWLSPGDTVAVPSGTVLPKGWIVPGVTYEVR